MELVMELFLMLVGFGIFVFLCLAGASINDYVNKDEDQPK